MKIWMWAAATMSVAAASLAPVGHASAAEPGLSMFRFSPQPREAAPTPAARPAAHTAPVRNTAWRQDKPVPPPVAAPAPMPAISGHSGIGAGSSGAVVGNGVAGGAVISQTAWNHEHVYTGYVYGPGSCDYTPPCTDHLWDGYCQRPHRCGGHCGLFHHHRGCGYGGCSTCGEVSYDMGCSSGCGRHHGGCHGFRLHGRHCNTGCDSCASSCADACGCGHRHFGGHRLFAKCGGWFNNLCNACDGGMSCGCAAPIGNGIPSLNPESVPTPSADPGPAPMSDDAKSARAPLLNRYLPWSIK